MTEKCAVNLNSKIRVSCLSACSMGFQLLRVLVGRKVEVEGVGGREGG